VKEEVLISTAKEKTDKALKLQKYLRDFRNITENIYNRRILKIVTYAATEDINVENMTIEERKLFEKILESLKNHKRDIFSMETEATNKKSIVEKKEKQKVIEKEIEEREKILVHVLEDIPPFVIDNKTCILKKEDVLTLPEKVVDILKKRGSVRVVEVSQ